MKHTVEHIETLIKKRNAFGVSELDSTDLAVEAEALRRYKTHLEGKAYHVEVRPIEEAGDLKPITSLRDQLAMAALPTFLNALVDYNDAEKAVNIAVAMAYKTADAMMEEREK